MKYSYKLMVLVSMVSLMSFAKATDTVAEELKAAVTAADFQKVKKYLRKLDRQAMTAQERKNVLSDLVGHVDVRLEQHKSAGFLNNRWDLLRCVGGALVGVYALSYMVHNAHAMVTGACGYCKTINCNNSCRCPECGVRYGAHTCVQRPQYTSKNGSSRWIYGLTSLPSVGFAAAGFYQLYEGLRGASQHSKVVSTESVLELLNEKING